MCRCTDIPVYILLVMGSVNIAALQSTLLGIVDQLQQLRGSPAECNTWWRRPCPGIPEVSTFYNHSFVSLQKRDRRRSWYQETSYNPVVDSNKVEEEVFSSAEVDLVVSVNNESNDCQVSEPTEYHNDKTVVEADIVFDFAESVDLEESVNTEIMESSDGNCDSVVKVNHRIQSVGGSRSDSYHGQGVQCERDTRSHHAMTSSPMKQILERDLPSPELTVHLPRGQSSTRDSHQEPDSTQACQWSSQDKEPPDMSDSLRIIYFEWIV